MNSFNEQVIPFSEKFDDALISQYLQLLPDLRLHMAIVGMQSRQFALESVGIIQREHPLIQPPHACQDIGRPAA